MIDLEKLRIWDDPGETLCADAADEIERLRAALQRVDALNDNPAHFNSEINEVVMQALEPSSHQ